MSFRGYNVAMRQDIVTSLVRSAHALDAEYRTISDPRQRGAIIEQLRRIEWRVNALATPDAFRLPYQSASRAH